jgi:putative ABC transport system permease protein
VLLNYLKTAYRALLRQRLYTIVNLIGLAIGLTCSLLILLYVRHELGYESFNRDGDRVFRMVRQEALLHPVPLAEAMLAALPEVEAIARHSPRSRILIGRGNVKAVRSLVLADPELLDILDIPFTRGTRGKALAGPNRVAISTEMALAYFGDDDPIGQTLRYDEKLDLEVTGVYELPANTHFPFQLVVSFSTIWIEAASGTVDPSRWSGAGSDAYFYVKARDAGPIREFDQRVLEAAGSHHPWLREKWEQAGMIPALQPIQDIHLHSHRARELELNAHAADVYVMAAIGAFILIIASVNFINLSTARSTERVKEIGMRKVMGARRAQIIAQFLCESAAQVAVAAALALLLTRLAMPVFRNLTGIEMTASGGDLGQGLWLLVVLAVIAFLGAGYPSLVLTRFESIRVFKDGSKTGRTGLPLRRRLVEFQFALSILMLLFTIAVYQQVQFLGRTEVGFQTEHTVVFPMVAPYPGTAQRMETMLERMAKARSVSGLGRVHLPPFQGFEPRSNASTRLGASEALDIPVISVDAGFVPTLGLDLIAGRNVAEGLGPDQTEALLNQSALLAFGLREPIDALGLPIDLGWRGRGSVVGVVRDFHYESLHHGIGPVVVRSPRFIRLGEAAPQLYYWHVAVRFEPGSLSNGVEELEAIWADFLQDYPFTYWFLDESRKHQYASVARLSNLLSWFSGLALCVAALGVFTLAMFTAQQRTKELGVRKALGATGSGILLLLARDFGRLFLVGVLVALPIGYYATQRWLDGFAYHAELGLAAFGGAPLIVLLVAAAAVAQQVARVARMNPVDALRQE